LSPIREGEAYVAADINPASRPSFEANGVVTRIPLCAACARNDLSAAATLARK